MFSTRYVAILADIVYGGRNVTRFDRRTGQVSAVGPLGGRGNVPGAPPYRTVRTMPVVFSEVDKRSLFFANNHLWKTMNGGKSWTRISPDLTRKTWETSSAHLPYARWRRDLDADRQREPRRRDGQRGARGSQEEGTSLRGHRTR